MIYNKIYMEGCMKQGEEIYEGIVQYLTHPYSVEMTFKDIMLDYNYIVRTLFDSISVHPKLQKISLVNCRLNNGMLSNLMYILIQE